MPPDTLAAVHRGLLGWFEYYPLALVLVGIVGLPRPAWERLALPRLNVATAAIGLSWLLISGWELLRAWYSQVEFEQYAFVDSNSGLYVPTHYWPAYLTGLLPVLATQLLWWPRLRRSFSFSLGLGLALLAQPILEFVAIRLLSLHHDYLPSSWVMLSPDALPRLLLLLSGLAVLLWLRRRYSAKRA